MYFKCILDLEEHLSEPEITMVGEWWQKDNNVYYIVAGTRLSILCRIKEGIAKWIHPNDSMVVSIHKMLLLIIIKTNSGYLLFLAYNHID